MLRIEKGKVLKPSEDKLLVEKQDIINLPDNNTIIIENGKLKALGGGGGDAWVDFVLSGNSPASADQPFEAYSYVTMKDYACLECKLAVNEGELAKAPMTIMMSYGAKVIFTAIDNKIECSFRRKYLDQDHNTTAFYPYDAKTNVTLSFRQSSIAEYDIQLIEKKPIIFEPETRGNYSRIYSQDELFAAMKDLIKQTFDKDSFVIVDTDKSEVSDKKLIPTNKVVKKVKQNKRKR